MPDMILSGHGRLDQSHHDSNRMEPAMRKLTFGGVMVLGMAMLGCQQEQKPAQTTSARPTALDVSGPAVSSTPTYQPAPTSVATPAGDATVTQTSSASAANYTVKKGDTLYRIAKDRYGDGKQWQKIASANPGVSASTLRVGQTLVIPQ
jgi:nucleoid-associated protein YgaU